MSFLDDLKKKKKKKKKKSKKDKKRKAEEVEEADRAEAAAADSDESDDEYSDMTAAEKSAAKKKRLRETNEIAQVAGKSHRERVDEYNAKLGQLTEHNDLPRISAAGNG